MSADQNFNHEYPSPGRHGKKSKGLNHDSIQAIQHIPPKNITSATISTTPPPQALLAFQYAHNNQRMGWCWQFYYVPPGICPSARLDCVIIINNNNLGTREMAKKDQLMRVQNPPDEYRTEAAAQRYSDAWEKLTNNRDDTAFE